ncbi:MAG: glycoside hydrolase family 2 TIM barrel-domain containing protein [Bacillota bacterium]|nr:glycoside hydrolase family 2 TIM barrel-domain containing protein [Bacillota bacterium]
MLDRLNLSGTWQLRAVEEFSAAVRQAPWPGDGWLEQELPAHWQEHPALEQYTGRVVYRRRVVSRPEPGRRYFLRLNGVFYRYSAYLNGCLLGAHEGYFAPADFEVTGQLTGDDLLLLEVECPPETRKLGKRLITGIFSHWDHLDPMIEPGGVWLPVELLVTGPARLAWMGVETRGFDTRSAKVRVLLDVDAVEAADPLVTLAFTPANFVGETQVFKFRAPLQPGMNRLSYQCEIEQYRLWWPRGLGEPHLYEVEATLAGRDGASLDRLKVRTGLRTVALRKWVFYVNQERLFIKGNNYPPPEARLSRVTRERAEGDLKLAAAAHMNMLRVHAHIDHPVFYEAADEQGMLLWQDFPLQWLYAREVMPEAERQVREMVRLLGNHPSIALWCMHNEPVYMVDTKDESFGRALKTDFSVFVYSWNRDVMDRRLARAARREDPSRPVLRASGEIALLHRGGDTHWYFGWYKTHGPLRLFDLVRRLVPRNIRFLSEFGAQSFPNKESAVRFMASDLARLDWETLARRHSAQPDIMRLWLDLDACRDLETLIALTQWYQMRLNQFYIDRLRFHKYRPTGGMLAFSFADPNPAVSWAVVDYWRVPKASYHHLARCYHPEYVFTLLDKDTYRPGETVRLPVYLTSDSLRSYPQVEARARVIGPAGDEVAAGRFSARLPADARAFSPGELSFIPAIPGKYLVLLDLEYEGEVFRNSYEVFVADRPPVRWGPEVLSAPTVDSARP